MSKALQASTIEADLALESMQGFDVPQHLVSEILSGRCIAFVGAGFSRPALPGWSELLRALSESIPAYTPKKQRESLQRMAKSATAALDLEAVAQAIKDSFGDERGAFERAIQEALQVKENDEAAQSGIERVNRRVRWLDEIPFKAVLTTNFDQFLKGLPPGTETYRSILRDNSKWWQQRNWNVAKGETTRPLLKLHGDANGDPYDAPVVLARSDYRKMLHEQSRHPHFLRAVFGSHTLLFLGVSFTDAYLNELRSEALSYLHQPGNQNPMAYAIMENRPPEMREFFRRHEGIHVLPFDTKDHGWLGFDKWLQQIRNATSAETRLRQLLKSTCDNDDECAPKVVWLDPKPQNNIIGYSYLERAGAEVITVKHPDDLCKDTHGDAQLVIMCFGHHPQNAPFAVEAMRVLNQWEDRPPAIVFASKEFRVANRRTVMRHGAWEYASTWGELFFLLEQLFGRNRR